MATTAQSSSTSADPSVDPLRRLSEEGVAIWLDDMSRGRLATDNLADLIRDKYVVGVTTNPTIFQKAISDSELYDRQVRDLAIRGVDVEEALRMITTFDVRWACDVLRPVYDASDGVDGRVSIEVDPRLAHETDRTIAEARQLWWLVDRPNLFVKIPATKAGLPAIAQCIAEGISVNVTLIFSLERYGAVMEAYLDGMERARVAGHDLTNLASVASFFVSRVDTEVDKRLSKLGSADAKKLLGKAAIANARLAFQRYEQVFSTDRWTSLAGAGARPQRPLWASTGVKDPSYDDTMYVVELTTRGVVNTMPEPTLEALADHGVVRGDTIRGAYADAQAVMSALADAGIDVDDVVQVLEDEGVEKFETSWSELLESTRKELTRLAKGDS
ncbi:MAG: transaldolase [Spirochaetaceae bacterium]|nr:transaldolase [Spirochaetaceae bacterium]